MITNLRLKGFKSFADIEELELKPLTLLIGANATGKSNLRDAFRVLHGIGLGYSLVEIVEGKYGSGGERVWAGIRGGQSELFTRGVESKTPSCSFSITIRDTSNHSWTYSITINPGDLTILDEQMHSPSDERFQPYAFKLKELGSNFIDVTCRQQGRRGKTYTFKNSHPVLDQIYESRGIDAELVGACAVVTETLAVLRFLEVTPDAVRKYVHPKQATLGDNGENLSAVVRALGGTERRALLEWLDELTPQDIRDFHFFENPQGHVLLGVEETGGRVISAYSMSDGSLRFLALVTLLMLGGSDQTLLLKEIENGIHPTRLDLMVRLLEQFSEKTQIIASSHSPLVLKYLMESSWPGVLIFKRDEATGNTVVRRLTDLPRLQEAIREDSLEFLMATGWMEEAIE